jgi:hypothetical protein
VRALRKSSRCQGVWVNKVAITNGPAADRGTLVGSVRLQWLGDGQSEHATANGTATYSTVNAQAHQLSIYDGGIYSGADPVLGCSYASATGPSSMVMRIADRIITGGKKTRVVMVPIAMGGTPWAIYDPSAAGSLFTRFHLHIDALAALGLAPDKIIVGRGATDNTLATSRRRSGPRSMHGSQAFAP